MASRSESYSADQLRRKFLTFFASKQHTVLPSDSLAPANDPTLLFTGAGMNQFKDQFLGRNITDPRVATCQKCLRVGDLDVVGATAAHHTFFEMLGNFSFGDYFKEGAIALAWEFFLGELGIPADRLYISIYAEDDEAFELWRKHVADDRIFRADAKSNFWPSNAPSLGPNGPCGPCSEIYFDTGASHLDHAPVPAARGRFHPDNRRYVEVWNLVFTGYNRTGPVPGAGVLEALPSRNIDTGMGLERLLAVLNGKFSNFDTELFTPIIARIGEIAGIGYTKDSPEGVKFRRIADHVRAATFCLGDGIRPGKDGRDYVLRKIIRRALRDGVDLGLEDPFLHELSPVVIDLMKDAYPDLGKQEDAIGRRLLAEQEQFLRAIRKGLPLVRNAMAVFAEGLSRAPVRSDDGNLVQAAGEFPVEDVYRLYETFGIPADFQKDMAAQEFGLSIDDEAWQRFLKSRKGQKSGKGEVFADTALDRLRHEAAPTEFVGYDRLECEAAVIGAFVIDRAHRQKFPALKDETIKDGHFAVVLDRTPFYGESGGQVGDTGVIRFGSHEFRVIETKKIEGYHIHVMQKNFCALVFNNQWTVFPVSEGELANPDYHADDHKIQLDQGRCLCAVDADRRDAITRHHSATHLLHAVLRRHDPQAHQAGSLVTPDLLRFDVEYASRDLIPDAETLEREVTRAILANHEVRAGVGAKSDAEKAGVVMFFDEKYGDQVRTVRIGPGVSAELCGGCHVRATGEIGGFRIVSMAPIGAHVLRIVAVAGEKALELGQYHRRILETLRERLKATVVDELEDKTEKLHDELKRARAEIERLKKERFAQGAGGDDTEVRFIAGIKVLCRVMKAEDAAGLGDAADALREAQNLGIVVLGAPTDKGRAGPPGQAGPPGRATLVVSIAPKLVQERHLDATALIKPIAAIIGGGGGGKRGFAQAGGKDASKLDEAIAKAPELIAKALGE